MNIVWADNGDAVSIQYAGTPAIRSDFTRTGVCMLKVNWVVFDMWLATFRGQFNDGMNSVTRYIINNFEDGFNQDAIDLLIQTRCQGAKQLPKAYVPGNALSVCVLFREQFPVHQIPSIYFPF